MSDIPTVKLELDEILDLHGILSLMDEAQLYDDKLYANDRIKILIRAMKDAVVSSCTVDQVREAYDRLQLNHEVFTIINS